MFEWEMPLPVDLPKDFYFDKGTPGLHYAKECDEMMDFPSLKDIVPVKVGHPKEDYDFSWIYNQGDVIVKIKCEDGVFILLRKHKTGG